MNDSHNLFTYVSKSFNNPSYVKHVISVGVATNVFGYSDLWLKEVFIALYSL